LAKYYRCGIIMTNFSDETVLINLVKVIIALLLTSFSASLSKLVKIYINDKSATSFPKASANSAKILDNSSLTLHDLSSVAPIIIGKVYYLFSSLLSALARFFKESKANTLT